MSDATLFAAGIKINQGVRIGPLELRDLPFECERMRFIVLGISVVREDRAANREPPDQDWKELA